MNKIGIPFPAVDPLQFLVDDEIRPFIIDKRHDLTGTGAQACPTKSTGVFIVHEHVVPKNTVEIVMGVFPHVWQRTNPGALGVPNGESVALLDYKRVAGWVLFNQSKNDNQPYLVEIDYNAPSVSTSPNDKDRSTLGGTTFLSEDAPMMNNISLRNPLGTTYLPANSQFQVTFQLMPSPKIAANVLPNPWVIGDTVNTNNRIDFAGAMVYGVRMPQTTYAKLREARRAGMLGPEASVRDLDAILKRGGGL